MNLVHVHIENFKQFVDPLDIDIPSQATVGVIGVNGVGKTTLFQAIEWCLYNPSTMLGKDIRPRGRSGNPRVAVTLESHDGSTRWVVERELKRSTTTAAIYKTDANVTDEPVVQGTRDVTNFVANTLVELSHRAFVATFFTRQKELHFFGDVRDTERRREVGKLLGLETIRDAQKAIGEDRASAAREAQVLEKQYESEISGRDLEAESTAASQEVANAASAHAAALSAVTSATKQTAAVRSNLEIIQAKQTTYTEIRNRRDRARQERNNTANMHRERIETIANLEQLAVRRRELLPVAERRSQLDAQVTAVEKERERFLRRQDLERRLLANTNQHDTIHTTIITEVHSVQVPATITGWVWEAGDRNDATAGFSRLQGIARHWAIPAVESRLASLTLAHNANLDLQRHEKRLHECHTLQNKLKKDRETLISGNDPEDHLQRIADLRARLENELKTWASSRERLEAECKKQHRLIENLRKADFGEGCPTCGRPFSETDAADAIQSFQQLARNYQDEITAGDQEADGNRQSLKELGQTELAQQKRLADLRELDSRIQKSIGVISQQEDLVANAREALQRALAVANLTTTPQPDDLDAATAELHLARSLHQALDRCSIHITTLQQLTIEATQLRTDHLTVQDATFDDAAYRTLLLQQKEAISAQSRIEEFDRQLAHLPQVIAERDQCANLLTELDTAIARLESELANVGFHPDQLASAVTAVKEAEEAERSATANERKLEHAHRNCEFRQQQLMAEHQRIRQREIDARARRREADELTQMYTLFGEFEQFVVSRLTPALSEMTSELVRQVTDGKYDDVTFDDNFGIMVSDGEELPFPLATFSGGERDAIALCARLALSQMIGQQSSQQPGFLVLDEVFGSLDRERRTRLLELFGNLTSTAGNFQQVFIISHVDDVRTAPVLDELWLVKESDAGTSSLESLPMGSDIGEL